MKIGAGLFGRGRQRLDVMEESNKYGFVMQEGLGIIPMVKYIGILEWTYLHQFP